MPARCIQQVALQLQQRTISIVAEDIKSRTRLSSPVYLALGSNGPGFVDEGNPLCNRNLRCSGLCGINLVMLQMLPPTLRPSTTDLTAAGAWAFTGGCAVLFLVQVITPVLRGSQNASITCASFVIACFVAAAF